MNSHDDSQAEKHRIVKAAIELIERRREPVTIATLASELRIPRANLDTLFEEERDLVAAIVDEWFAPDVAIMEEVVATDLPPDRKMFEFFARRFAKEKQRYDADPALFSLYLEIGSQHFAEVEGYIQLADHYLTEIIAEAQAAGHFAGLSLSRALTLINQMVMCYTNPQIILMIPDRLDETKLAAIIDTLFAGLTGKDGNAAGVSTIQPVPQ